MADIEVADFARPGSYELLKAKIEGVSIALTDQIMEFWKQNEDLEVQIDIAADANDEPPFNGGPNLYLRIKNRRHRGVSTPFKQRSRGFIWFFSFLVWFDSVQQQMAASPNQAVVLLLDEPGLSLHALAQSDLLKYIDALGRRHQVIYTTHSPFLIDAGHLDQVRTVEDLSRKGTTIADTPASSDPRTVFPLQVALATSLAGELLPDGRCLLVEGVSDLVILTLMAARCEPPRTIGSEIAIVPMGGSTRLGAFAALVAPGDRRIAVLQSPATNAVAAGAKALPAHIAWLQPAAFAAGAVTGAADLEDLFEPSFYLRAFTQAFADPLSGRQIDVADLPSGARIVERLAGWLAAEGHTLSAGGGFDRLKVATQLAQGALSDIDGATRARFEALFAAVRKALATA
jgi:hypothetical protein